MRRYSTNSVRFTNSALKAKTLFPSHQAGSVRMFSSQQPDLSTSDKKDKPIDHDAIRENELNKYYRPIFKAQRAYNYDYVYRTIDPASSLISKVVTRARYTVEDCISFCLDIKRGDTNAVMFKTAGCLKR